MRSPFILALLSTNLRASLALRHAFLVQALFMLFNNLAFCLTWWILFRRFPSVGGWALGDVLALFGVTATGFGLSVTLFGGVRDLARAIVEGELDSLLTQPRSVLLQAAAGRSVASGWGDVVSGVVLLVLSGYASARTALPFLIAVCSACVVLTASAVIIQSFAFWVGRMEGLARQLWDVVITFSTYPPSLFGGALRLVLYTLVPAGFVSYLPVELVRDFRVETALAVVGGAAGWAWLALSIFGRGLRRYESGNRLVVRA